MRPSSLPASGRADGRFRTLVSAAKNPVPGAEKVWWRELRLEAVAAGCALRLKSVNVKKWDQGPRSDPGEGCCEHVRQERRYRVSIGISAPAQNRGRYGIFHVAINRVEREHAVGVISIVEARGS